MKAAINPSANYSNKTNEVQKQSINVKKKFIASFALFEPEDFISERSRKNLFHFRFKGETFRDVLKERFIANTDIDNLEVGVQIDNNLTFYFNVKKILWYQNSEVCDIVIKRRSKSEFEYIRNSYFRQRTAKKNNMAKNDVRTSYEI